MLATGGREAHMLMRLCSVRGACSVICECHRSQRTAPPASEMPSISCPTRWTPCHHSRMSAFRAFVRNPLATSEDFLAVFLPSSAFCWEWLFPFECTKLLSTRAFDCTRWTRIWVTTAPWTSENVQLYSKWRFSPRHMMSRRHRECGGLLVRGPPSAAPALLVLSPLIVRRGGDLVHRPLSF
jgi:hypothetical protein